MAGVTTRATKGSPLSATEHDDNLETIINLHKSATEPSPTYACMLWADTATTLLKQRNTADSAWTTLGTLDTAGSFGGGSSDVVDDTTPQLGGNLDMQAHSIEGVTATEMGYLDGVTSDIQTQLDTKLSSVADNSVTLAKMAGGTDGNLITYDASGDPAYVTTGTSGQVLTSGGTGVAPTFQTAASGGADWDTRWTFGLTSGYSGNNAVINWSDVTLGSDNSNSSGRITIGTAGKYMIFLSISLTSAGGTVSEYLRVNTTRQAGRVYAESTTNYHGEFQAWILDLAVNDVVDVWLDGGGTLHGSATTEAQQCRWTGIKIG